VKKRAYMIGYGKQGKIIGEGLQKDQFRITVIESDKTRYKQAKEDGFADVMLMDVTKDENLENLLVEKKDHLICVMDDIHLNVYLTLTLHDLFPSSPIVALSDSIHTTEKLYMAGATRVIDLYRVTANRIHNLLRKPVATKLLDGFILNTHNISFREIEIPKDSFLDGVMVDEADLSKYGIMLIGMIDKELSNHFIFITSGISHKLDSGDILVCIGEQEDLEHFEAVIRRSEA